jgi:uncharacterized protein YbjT (DUF2867 family)
MRTVLVTGGTGRLGGALLAELQRGSARLRVLSRRPSKPGQEGVEWVTGDLRTGAGLPHAVADATVIIHCATDVLVPRRDLAGTRALVEAGRRVGQPHLVYISIVGIDEVPLPYYRIKLEVERYVQACGLPWTILRATQFHNLLFELIRAVARLPVMLLPASTSFQPVDVREVASRLAALVGSGPAGRVPDLGGPQVLPVVDLAYDYLQVFERRRTVFPVTIRARSDAGIAMAGT